MFVPGSVKTADQWTLDPSHMIQIHRDAGGKHLCDVILASSNPQVLARGEGDSLLDALKDALAKAGIK